MRELNYELKKLCQRNRDGSYGTRADRERILDLIANQLHDLGFRHMHASSLKGKHVVALVARWKAEGISPGTIKNRMAQLRWLAEKNGTPGIIAPSNDAYGIADSVYVTNISKAVSLDLERLARITDPNTQMSLRLESAFGLRRKESIMICPACADRDDRLVLKASWTKGGRAREIPIRTAEQRQVLDEAKQLAGRGSLIPKAMRYVEQLHRFEAQCNKVGIDHVHGLRHRYAQERYRELTSWECPANGGPKSRQLTPEQKRIDREARTTINVPDLILIDYKMRELDGIETIRRLRQLPNCADAPIVMVTASGDMKVRHDAFDAGATDFLVKPYDQYEARARCRNLLTMRQQHLLLKDRAKLLEYEIAAAVREMRYRERETIMLAANLSEYHAHQHGFRIVRIARYAGLIGEGMGLPPDMVERIELASTLHDIGKIGIADEILMGDGELSEAQEQALREHTEIGYKLLEQSSSEYLKMAAEICLHHHERYDGRGYPKGLKGREIPLPARVVAVAEAFDVLTSARHHNRADQVATAMKNIVSRKGTEFDPVCVEALSCQFDKAGEIIATFTDPM